MWIKTVRILFEGWECSADKKLTHKIFSKEGTNVVATVTRQHDQGNFNTYLRSLVERELSKTIKSLAKHYQKLFTDKCKTQRFAIGASLAMKQEDEESILEQLFHVVNQELEKCGPRFQSILNEHSKKMESFIADLATNLAKKGNYKNPAILDKKRTTDLSILSFTHIKHYLSII